MHPPHLYSHRHSDRCDIMVMNESVGILKSASSGNQGQMVIFYESCGIIKPNEQDYFGRQIHQTWRWLCRWENEDVVFQKHDNFSTRLGNKLKLEIVTAFMKTYWLSVLIMYVQSQIPEVPTVLENQAEINLFLHLSWSTSTASLTSVSSGN